MGEGPDADPGASGSQAGRASTIVVNTGGRLGRWSLPPGHSVTWPGRPEKGGPSRVDGGLPPGRDYRDAGRRMIV
jgi:hypothetical protein